MINKQQLAKELMGSILHTVVNNVTSGFGQSAPMQGETQRDANDRGQQVYERHFLTTDNVYAMRNFFRSMEEAGYAIQWQERDGGFEVMI